MPTVPYYREPHLGAHKDRVNFESRCMERLNVIHIMPHGCTLTDYSMTVTEISHKAQYGSVHHTALVCYGSTTDVAQQHCIATRTCLMLTARQGAHDKVEHQSIYMQRQIVMSMSCLMAGLLTCLERLKPRSSYEAQNGSFD